MTTKIKSANAAKFSPLQKQIILAQSHAADGEPAEAITAIDCALNSGPSLDTRKLLEKARAMFDCGHPPTGETLLDMALSEAGKQSKQCVGNLAGHTPGPWIVDDGIVTTQDMTAQLIDAQPKNEWVAVGIADSDGYAESVAYCHPLNAPLIAAAPDLIAALEAFLRAPSIGSSGPGSVSIEVTDFNLKAARAAISRARGN